MSLKSFDSDFDQYRKNRIRFQNKELPDDAQGYENSALRELERVEAREVRDQKLTREVHEFFSTATQQAASIVERMAHDAEAQADVQVEQEMESFLIDAFARMNTLVMAMVHKREGGTAEERLEPKVANLVGQMLDEFRWEGTADLLDKHIGQDPFDTDLDEVRRELQTHSEMDTDHMDGESSAPIEDHLVAAVENPEDSEEMMDRLAMEADEEARQAEEERMRATDDDADDGDEVEGAERYAASDEPQPARAEPPAREAPKAPVAGSKADELERFKQALKSLVRQGTMTREEARAAWVTRLRSLGAGSAR